MKISKLSYTATSRPVVALAIVAMSFAGLPLAHSADRSRRPESFSGLHNDYTPAASTLVGGPYEMHGTWSLHLRERDAAIFFGERTMDTDKVSMDDLIKQGYKCTTSSAGAMDCVKQGSPTYVCHVGEYCIKDPFQ